MISDIVVQYNLREHPLIGCDGLIRANHIILEVMIGVFLTNDNCLLATYYLVIPYLVSII